MKQPGIPGSTSNVRTMKDVERNIRDRRKHFASHGFLVALEGPASLAQFKSFVPRVAFFVMCFQDLLRLVESLSSDATLKAAAKIHAGEDKGHDHWYLSDVRRLGVPLDISLLFSDAHRETRDVVYRQISKVVSAKHDQSRLAIALSLEAIGAECFERAIGMSERLGCADGLHYFARTHQAVEASHQVFEGEAQSQLARILVSDEAWVEVVEAIDSTFEGMTTLMTGLEKAFHSA